MRSSLLAVTSIAAFALLAGCNGASGNAGGDTTCDDYLAMTSSEQKEVIKTFRESEGKDPSGGEINLSAASAKLFCNTVGKGSDPIRKIDTG